jgi:serine/threonine-protein kinase HipA
MSNRLIAIAGGRLMGEVRHEGGRLDFQYDTAWSNDASSFPMSISLPLVVREHGHSAIEAFLWGLLPDNEVVLQRWGQKFRVSPRNPFRLIEHVGEDCAGAIQFARPDRADHLFGRSRKPTVCWISKRELEERIALLVHDAAATRLGGDNGQFSLAGAQPKIALYRDLNSARWGVPEGRTPTTHILKPSTGAFDGQAENEHFCLRLVAELGFAAVNSTVLDCAGFPVIVIERYDRLARGSIIHRIHQEDMCQALAVRPQKKYQNQGGPSAKAIMELIRAHSVAPDEDAKRFADALIFNWLIGGTDGHAKNYSFLLAEGGQVRLAPLYDLASCLPYTRQIPPRTATLAMKIGSEYRLRRIERREWETCARELRIPAKSLLARIAEVATILPEAAERTAHALSKDGIKHPVVADLVEGIRSNTKKCVELLQKSA